MSITLSFAIDNIIGDLWEREYQQYAEKYDVEEPDDIPSEKLENSYYQDIRMIRDYIKIKEEENKKLQEKLEEENKGLKETLEDTNKEMSFYVGENRVLHKNHTKEINVIIDQRKAIQEQKQQIADLEEQVSSAIAPENVSDWIEDDGEYKVITTEELEELKEEIEELQEEIQEIKDKSVPLERLEEEEEKVEELQEENKKLKEELEKKKTWQDTTIKKGRQEMKELNEENEKLQEELKLAKDGFKLLECVDCKCIILDDLQGQIDKLKEE